MKILIPVLEFGRAGGYRVLSNLANEWIKMGHEVHFLSPIASIKPYFPTTAIVHWVDKDGNLVDDTNLLDPETYRFWHRWKGLRLGIQNLNEDFDVTLANHSLTAYPVARAKVKGKKFYYIQAYEPEYGYLNGSVSHKVLGVIAWNSYHLNLVKIVNASIYKRYENISCDKVVLPGLDLDIFTKKPEPSISQTIKIGCIGRMESYKGTSYVLDAFLLLQKQMENVELHVAFGDSDLPSRYEGVIVDVPKNDRELADFYRNMDVIVAPGTIQLGAVHYPVIESMACGTPVITTGYYPADETNAWIVPVKDAEAIVEQLMSVINDEPIRRKKVEKAAQDVVQFKWDVVASKMFNYFQN